MFGLHYLHAPSFHQPTHARGTPSERRVYSSRNALPLDSIPRLIPRLLSLPLLPRSIRPRPLATRGASPPWIIKLFKRSCNAADTECWVSFGVDTQLSPVVNCSYGVKGTQASRRSTDSISCGPYTISSGWNGSFGAGNGFTTWAIANHGQAIVAWPSYADRDLVNGVAVTPDRSFAPSKF